MLYLINAVMYFAHRYAAMVPVICLPLALGGCGLALLGTAAGTGVTVSQERTTGNAINDTGLYIKLSAKVFERSDRIYDDAIIRVLEGNVYVFGRVDSEEDKNILLKIINESEGVIDVYEDVKVYQKGSRDVMLDSRIELSIENDLILEKGVRSLNYKVDVFNRNVYITGISQNDEELRIVTTIARRVEGVKEVVSYVINKDTRKQHGGDN